jgi:hypothetical protein
MVMLASKPENNNPDGEEMTSAARSGALARRAAQKANAHSAPCAAGQHIMKNEINSAGSGMAAWQKAAARRGA